MHRESSPAALARIPDAFRFIVKDDRLIEAVCCIRNGCEIAFEIDEPKSVEDESPDETPDDLILRIKSMEKVLAKDHDPGFAEFLSTFLCNVISDLSMSGPQRSVSPQKFAAEFLGRLRIDSQLSQVRKNVTKWEDRPFENGIYDWYLRDDRFEPVPVTAVAWSLAIEHFPQKGLPRFWELLGFVLPGPTRRRVFTPAYQDLLADYFETRHEEFRGPIASRWLCLCFTVRSVGLIITCAGVAARATAIGALIWFIPPSARKAIWDFCYRLLKR